MNRTPRRRNFRDVERVGPENAPTLPKAAYDGIEACRQSGDCNMFEFNRVHRWCYEHEYYAAVVWMDENPSAYGTGVLSGMWRIVEETGETPVDYSDNEAFAELPGEVVEWMNDDLNEQRLTRTQVVGRNHEPVTPQS